jgi:hypothetical protein
MVSHLQEVIVHCAGAALLAHTPGSVHLDRLIALDVDVRASCEHVRQPRQDLGDETAPVRGIDEHDVEPALPRRGEEV